MFERIGRIMEISKLDPQVELDRVEAHLKTLVEDDEIRRIYVRFRDRLKELIEEGKSK